MKKFLFTTVVMAVFAIGFTASDEEESSSPETKQETIEEFRARMDRENAERRTRLQKEEAERKVKEQKEKQEKRKNMFKEAYENGYNTAIQYTFYQDCHIHYANEYGAPKSDADIALYKQYKIQYDKGWDAGRAVRNKMNE